MTEYSVDVHDAYSGPPDWLGAARIALLWTDPPAASTAAERARILELWRSSDAIVLGPTDTSDRSLERITADILRTTKPGDLVVDPFVGTGATGAAALAVKRVFYGCDIDAEMVKRTLGRLSGEPFDPAYGGWTGAQQ